MIANPRAYAISEAGHLAASDDCAAYSLLADDCWAASSMELLILICSPRLSFQPKDPTDVRTTAYRGIVICSPFRW